MSCTGCDSERVMMVSAKCSDLCCVSLGGREIEGYVPRGPLGGGDYIEMSICLDCGKVQGDFPVTDEDAGFDEET